MDYTGPPELTLARAFSQWTADVPVIAVVVLAGAAYLAGVARARRGARGEDSTAGPAAAWPAGRAVAFCGLGLGFLVLATMSWIGVYQGVLFYARATQTVLLVLVVPLFLAMGKPLTLLEAACPAAARRAGVIVKSRLMVALTFPAITTLALVAVPFTMYFTGWYTATFHSAAIRELTCLALIAPGYLFFWTLLRVDPVPRRYSYAVSMWITGVEVIGDAFFGIAVIASNANLIGGAYYHALHRPWGPAPATDQVLGGGVLWILGDFVGLPFLAVQFIQLMREDKAAADAIDAELDAREVITEATRVARAAASPAATADAAPDAAPDADPGAEAEDDPDRPWWEGDPRFTNRFKPT
jgi:cytochrome c oxidase assembly factor CtaG